MGWTWQRNLVTFAMLMFGTCSSVYAQSQTAKVLKLNLEDYGWQPLPKQQRAEWGGTRSRLVAIDHQGRVLVGFTVRENYSLATRERPGLSFHILRFTLKGKVDLSVILPTNSWYNNGLYLGVDDHVYARANNDLQFLPEEQDAPNEGGVWRTGAVLDELPYHSIT